MSALVLPVIIMQLILCVSNTGVRTVMGGCSTLPDIRYSRNNMSDIHPDMYKNGDTAIFSCLSGSAPIGNAVYVCTGGKWIGGPFSCQIKICGFLGSPQNGERIGDSYEVGSVMGFKCYTGYDLVGSPTMQCKPNSKWQPPNIPACRRKKCPAIPDIENGDIVVDHSVGGQNDVYGTILQVKCLGNFIRNGPSRISCNEKGNWTKEPTCEDVLCPRYPGLDSECVLRTNVVKRASRALLFLFCTSNSTMANGVATCSNNEWDNSNLGCWCDCSVKATDEFIQFENVKSGGFLKHGETLFWSCKNGTKKGTSEQLTCSDGSIHTPSCVFGALQTDGLSWEIVPVVIGALLVVFLIILAGCIYVRCKGRRSKQIKKTSNTEDAEALPTDTTHDVIEKKTLHKADGKQTYLDGDTTSYERCSTDSNPNLLVQKPKTYPKKAPVPLPKPSKRQIIETNPTDTAKLLPAQTDGIEPDIPVTISPIKPTTVVTEVMIPVQKPATDKKDIGTITLILSLDQLGESNSQTTEPLDAENHLPIEARDKEFPLQAPASNKMDAATSYQMQSTNQSGVKGSLSDINNLDYNQMPVQITDPIDTGNSLPMQPNYIVNCNGKQLETSPLQVPAISDTDPRIQFQTCKSNSKIFLPTEVNEGDSPLNKTMPMETNDACQLLQTPNDEAQILSQEESLPQNSLETTQDTNLNNSRLPKRSQQPIQEYPKIGPVEVRP